MSSAHDPSANRIQVLICDDHPSIQEALSARIENAMGLSCIGTCSSAREAMTMLEETDPDVMILDISLEESYGLDLLENIRNVYPELEVVVFSMYDEEIYAERAIRRGARSYLMKTAPTSVVIEAIRSAADGEVYLSDEMSAAILNQLPRDRDSESGFPIDQLTDRELAVFQMLGRGHSVSEITDRLNLCRKTIETYRRRAKEKLGLDSTNELLQRSIAWIHSQGKRKAPKPGG